MAAMAGLLLAVLALLAHAANHAEAAATTGMLNETDAAIMRKLYSVVCLDCLSDVLRLPSTHSAGGLLWNLSSNPCVWYGVECELDPEAPETLRVTGLSFDLGSELAHRGRSFLMYNGVPKELVKLDRLQTLDLQNNYLQALPSWLDELRWLVVLDVRNNALLSLPRAIGNMPLLRRLHLSFNTFFSGQFPKEFGNLRGLEYLDMVRCDVAASIPELLSGLVSLQYLNLSHNFYMGKIPGWLAQLPSLQVLDISYNNMWGTLPPFVNNLTVFLYQGNSFCTGGSCGGKSTTLLTSIASLCAALAILLTFGSLGFYCRWRRQRDILRVQEEMASYGAAQARLATPSPLELSTTVHGPGLPKDGVILGDNPDQVAVYMDGKIIGVAYPEAGGLSPPREH